MTKPPKTPLGIFLRNRRKALGLTQAQLAEQIGKTRSWVALIEGGYMPNPTMSTVQNVARALGINASEIWRMVDGELHACPMCTFLSRVAICPACGFNKERVS